MVHDINKPLRARIAWASAENRFSIPTSLKVGPDEALKAAFDKAQFGVTVIHNVNTNPTIASRPLPRVDLAVIDLRTSRAPASDADMLLQGIRRTRPLAGIVILCTPNISEHARTKLERIGECCYLVDSADAVVTLVREKLRAARIAEEAGERLKSLAAVAKHAAHTNKHPKRSKRKLLLAGTPTPNVLTLINAMEPNEVTCVLSASQVLRALETKKFDGMIFMPTDKSDLLYALARALRRHRELSQTPILAIAEDNDTLSAFATLGCKTLDERHLADVARTIETMVESGFMTATLRHYLHTTLKPLRDGKHKQIDFFGHHLMRLAERSQSRGNPLSVIALSVAKQKRPVGGNPLAIATRIVRAEDCVLKLSDDSLIIIAPNTLAEDAEKIGARLSGVIDGRSSPIKKSNRQHSGTLSQKTLQRHAANNDFRHGGRAAVVEWQTGETPDQLLIRLLANLNDANTSQAAF
ncbi:MAG: hypothetical protein AAF720_09505 [Pseudomonadota bacterium]